MRPNRPLAVLAAVSGAVAVAIGAFASHGAAETARPMLTTAGHYLMVHALLALVCAWLAAGSKALLWAGRLALLGGAVFASALTLIALAGWRFMGMVAPIGGLLMISAWLLAAFAAFRSRPRLAD